MIGVLFILFLLWICLLATSPIWGYSISRKLWLSPLPVCELNWGLAGRVYSAWKWRPTVRRMWRSRERNTRVLLNKRGSPVAASYKGRWWWRRCGTEDFYDLEPTERESYKRGWWGATPFFSTRATNWKSLVMNQLTHTMGLENDPD